MVSEVWRSGSDAWTVLCQGGLTAVREARGSSGDGANLVETCVSLIAVAHFFGGSAGDQGLRRCVEPVLCDPRQPAGVGGTVGRQSIRKVYRRGRAQGMRFVCWTRDTCFAGLTCDNSHNPPDWSLPTL